MNEKPSYLGLLNTISNAESGAECYLGAWAEATPRDDVRKIIAAVALREGEHGKAFAKRMCELGFDLQPKEDPKLAEKMALAASKTLSDREKFEKLLSLNVPDDPAKPDFFTSMFADKTIDIQTGQLLGRYIAEERDSGRMLRASYEQLLCEEEMSCAAPVGGAADAARLAAIDDRLCRIEAALEKLASR